MRLASDNSSSTTSFEAFKLEITVNYHVHCTLTLECRMGASHEISRADRCLFGLSSILSTRS